jgi:AAA+ superfamily predicted ATPase
MEMKTSLDQALIRPILDHLDWLKAFLEVRIKGHFDEKNETEQLPPLPIFDDDLIPYNQFVSTNQLDFVERVVLLMSIVPLLSPQIYDCFFIQNSSIGRPFSEFGGIELKSHRGFIPTAETINFVLNGNDVRKRMELCQIFSEDHFFFKNQILHLEKSPDTSFFWSSRLVINEDFFYHLISGEEIKPKFSTEFPAKELTTKLSMDDLILNHQLKDELSHILTWIKYREEIKSNDSLSRNFRAGYRALFYGPPGTGKSLTVALLGKLTQHPVYRIDLSRIVSKYIGETEKNLSRLLDKAENKNWILFFDEADALFSKRTEINDAKDKYANQGTSYLLQRLEEYHGLVILATNLRPNIDKAFVRRFQSILYFNLPSVQDRILLWENALVNINISPETNFQRLSEKYEVSGAAISNAIQFAWLNSKKNQKEMITSLDLEAGLLREMSKEGKSVRE